jgi:hypothetical protein
MYSEVWIWHVEYKGVFMYMNNENPVVWQQ